ncbi:MAG TPA: Flp pilus assembly protein CpaB [Solirubrobacterales bacterium]|nr:Flp pilus assembly protein CpaB [Solirubrobacterales bacterium]
MSRRARALAFLVAALICAILAATVAGRYRSRVEGRYGPLRPVVVSSAELPAGQPLGPERARAAMSIRRVPARFIPPGAIASPAEAVGRAPMATIPPGSYVLGAQLQIPDVEPPRPTGVGSGRRAVQVPIAGAEALLIGGSSPEGSRVDVVVSRQAGLGSSAYARIAASSVKLLALQGPAGPGEGWSATLAVTEEQALGLIGAQAAGREIRLLPRP